MKFKERLEKLKIFLNIEKELEIKTLELKEVEQKISENKSNLNLIEMELNKKRKELQSLKTEAVELKDFINSNFKEQFKDYDYRVNIKNCYIININGKKYISLRRKSHEKSDWYSLATGFYNVDTYKYFDALTLDKDGKYKFIHEYRHGYFDHKEYYGEEQIVNQVPEYEEHILELYPELNAFIDGYVPNTYLKKIYYEVNDLGRKSLTKVNKL